MKKDKKEREKEAIPAAPEAENERLPEAENAPEDAAPAEAVEAKAEEANALSREAAMEADVTLFHELFPEVRGDEIPAEVWEEVENGKSLAASYALHFVKALREKERVEAVNARNEKTAPPRIRHDGTEYEYFSPEAVSAMSGGEIRRNYNAILASMDHWN